VEVALGDTMILVKYLKEKDAFERYYKEYLAKRLLLNKSASVDTEKNIISRLKIECGGQFACDSEGILKVIS
jgi:hypothetical protein